MFADLSHLHLSKTGWRRGWRVGNDAAVEGHRHNRDLVANTALHQLPSVIPHSYVMWMDNCKSTTSSVFNTCRKALTSSEHP
jgi:hypothetical protein